MWSGINFSVQGFGCLHKRTFVLSCCFVWTRTKASTLFSKKRRDDGGSGDNLKALGYRLNCYFEFGRKMLFLFTQIIVTHVSFITLKTFDNPIDAHLLKTKLESEGIVVYLFDENINSINPLYNIATGGIKLNIAEQDLDRAVEVLREIDAAAYVDERDNVLLCPACGSTDLYNNYRSMRETKGFFSAVVSLLLLVFPIYYKLLYKCKSCGEEFRPAR